ncbi:MAG: 4-amino-4-deoxychorismate lyase [Pseudomonadota bacterium]|jgi:4-amino-4-deoxychorismate lyase|nr:4-amino-4-deoxychorismate lyase [Pseudomonadota bacterium]
MEQFWINGVPGRLIDITDRGLTYGDGLFETMAIRRYTPRFLDLHLDRLYAGAARLGLPAPERDKLHGQLTVAAAGIDEGVMKLILTRGPGPRGYAPPQRQAPTVAWGVQSQAVQQSTQIRVRWCATIAGRNPVTAGLKTLCRLEQVLARAEWQDASIAEGLMCDELGLLTGGTASNVFLVTGGSLWTPAVTHAGISGVMRRVILQQARGNGIEASETAVTRQVLLEADEVFISNALIGIRPVVQLEGRRWSPGPVTRSLAGQLVNLGVYECAGSC